MRSQQTYYGLMTLLLLQNDVLRYYDVIMMFLGRHLFAGLFTEKKSRHDANFVVIPGTADCRDDYLRSH